MLNKTPKVVDAVIVSARKRRVFVALACLVLVGLVAAFIYKRNSPYDTQLTVGGHRIVVEIAQTAEARAEGLSGRKSLDFGNGMLFIEDFGTESCVWMRNMQFSIDVMWFDGDRRLTHVEERVSPDTFPLSFCSDEPAAYILEVPAGYAQHIGTELFVTSLNF